MAPKKGSHDGVALALSLYACRVFNINCDINLEYKPNVKRGKKKEENNYKRGDAIWFRYSTRIHMHMLIVRTYKFFFLSFFLFLLFKFCCTMYTVFVQVVVGSYKFAHVYIVCVSMLYLSSYLVSISGFGRGRNVT